MIWQIFENFQKWAINNGYTPQLTIERKDYNDNYCPENCLWIPHSKQNSNTSKNKWIVAWGERKILADWAKDVRCNVHISTITKRLKRGWFPEEAISGKIKPIKYSNRKNNVFYAAWGETKTFTQWTEDERCKVKKNTLHERLRRGYSMEEALSMPLQVKYKDKEA